MAKDFDIMENSNASGNADIHSVSDPARRQWLRGGVGAMALKLGAAGFGTVGLGGLAACANIANTIPGTSATPLGATVVIKWPLFTFQGIATDISDAVRVPEGYVARAIAAWGEPVGIVGNTPAWKRDGSNTAAEQAVQMGMHHDGIHFYALPKAAGVAGGTARGLLVMNHEYTDDGLLHKDGFRPMTAEKVKKSQNAHGVAVIEVSQSAAKNGAWDMVRPSPYARRFTLDTPFAVQGPAAGHALMQTAADPAGRTVLGTLNNCASSITPWGTYLSGEENFRFYFGGGEAITPSQKRWGLGKVGAYDWEKFDARFDASKHPNEYHRFGWIVEIDPYDPKSTPIKRTAIGRGAHEGAWVAVTNDNRAVVYSGEDARFEYIYKFVSRDRIVSAADATKAGQTQAQANRTLLDHGTLYVARFNADGSGDWLPLVHPGKDSGMLALGVVHPLSPRAGFADQGEVLIKAREASDRLGGTKMDRPEWMTINPTTKQVYCTLTNNSARGKAGEPAADAANPRNTNVMGQIIRWTEGASKNSSKAGDFDATSFAWDHLMLAGDPAQPRAEAKGNIGGKSGKGDIFACPDGLVLDKRGVLWIQTDMHATEMYKGEMVNFGSNQMLACDPTTGETRRFLTGPPNCEITGVTFAPDHKTMFINVQHPGEPPNDRSDPATPRKFSNWPDFHPEGRPRSATVVIRREDGGVIGT